LACFLFFGDTQTLVQCPCCLNQDLTSDDQLNPMKWHEELVGERCTWSTWISCQSVARRTTFFASFAFALALTCRLWIIAATHAVAGKKICSKGYQESVILNKSFSLLLYEKKHFRLIHWPTISPSAEEIIWASFLPTHLTWYLNPAKKRTARILANGARLVS